MGRIEAEERKRRVLSLAVFIFTTLLLGTAVAMASYEEQQEHGHPDQHDRQQNRKVKKYEYNEYKTINSLMEVKHD